ncbi:MAG: GNAT family N-acetyltransferase [Asgard group archaeon]|nr:GNAT family N-acetyltransferase [Asgard group archaeon]
MIKMKIIKMTEKHIEDVIGVLSEAFNAWSYKRRGIARFRKRKIESLLPYLKQDPDGCFVAIEKKKVIGAIFSHVWGKLGWIGTFAVDPDFQEQGIGKKLMLKAIEYLDKNCNVTTLGLETMSDSSSNIGLYSKLGFRPAFQTIRLIKTISTTSLREDKFNDFASENNLEITYFSEEENKEDALARCYWLASKLLNGLNYNPEIQLTDDFGFGETILLKHEGFIVGYALCRTFDKYHDTDDNINLYVRIMAIDSDIQDRNYLDYLCYACEQFAAKNNKTELRLSINSSYWLAYEYLLNKKFKVRSSILRMIKYSDEIKSYDHRHEWLVNCATWTM